MTLRPLNDRVLLKRQAATQTTPSGLFVPTLAAEKSHLCVVEAVGPGRYNETTGQIVPLDIEPGQTVVLGHGPTEEVELNGEKLLIVRASDILAVLG